MAISAFSEPPRLLQAEIHREQGLARITGQGADASCRVEGGLVEDGVAGTAGDRCGEQLAGIRQVQQQDHVAFQAQRHGLRRVVQVFRERTLRAAQRASAQIARRIAGVGWGRVGGGFGTHRLGHRRRFRGREQPCVHARWCRRTLLPGQPVRGKDEHGVQGETQQQGEVERHREDSSHFAPPTRLAVPAGAAGISSAALRRADIYFRP